MKNEREKEGARGEMEREERGSEGEGEVGKPNEMDKTGEDTCIVREERESRHFHIVQHTRHNTAHIQTLNHNYIT
jgi:hypothetical protein